MWEYKIVYLPEGSSYNEENLNIFGKQGWELVNVHFCGSMNIKLAYHFKRRKPKPENPQNEI